MFKNTAYFHCVCLSSCRTPHKEGPTYVESVSSAVEDAAQTENYCNPKLAEWIGINVLPCSARRRISSLTAEMGHSRSSCAGNCVTLSVLTSLVSPPAAAEELKAPWPLSKFKFDNQWLHLCSHSI